VLALTACGPAGESASTTAAGSAQAAINDPFIIVMPQVGEIFDAASVLPAEISAVSYNLYDWMFDRDHEGRVQPGYAESWEVSEDKRELVVHLRKDVQFHTGQALTSADIPFSWDRIVEGGYSSRVTRAIESIEVIDEHTVKFLFNKPELAFVAVGGIPALSQQWFNEAGPDRFRQEPVGTGPYRFNQLQRGQYLELQRNENYWGKPPAIATVRFEFVTEDTTRVVKLQTGEADMAMMLPYPLVPQIENEPALKTVSLSPGGMTIFLALKTDNPETPWADVRVREAIALAIDRDAIIQHILLGYPRHFPFLAPTDLGFDPDLAPYSFDAERSRELLREAGAEGLKLQLRYIAGGATGVKETAEAIALYLTDVGIRTTTLPMEGPQFIPWVLQASRNPDEDYVALFIGGIAGRTESSNPIVAQLGAQTPFAWYTDAGVNDMVLEMSRTADDTARAEAIRAIGRKVHEQFRFIPMWTSTTIYGMKRCIDFTPTLGEYDLLMLRDVDVSACETKGAAKTP
jgi:peptide/nickel transport system substrate-binding protein